MPAEVATPDPVETRLGTLRFADGFPDAASAEKSYENLDFIRVVERSSTDAKRSTRPPANSW